MAKHKWHKHRKKKEEPAWKQEYLAEIALRPNQFNDAFTEVYAVPANRGSLEIMYNNNPNSYYHLIEGHTHQHMLSCPVQVAGTDRLTANGVRIVGQPHGWYLEGFEATKLNDNVIEVAIYGRVDSDRHNQSEREDLGMVRSETIPRYGQGYSLAQ